MAAVTSRIDGTVVQKPFTWSYSKLTSFETCALKYYKCDVTKEFNDSNSEQQSWGQHVHDCGAKAIKAGTSEVPEGVKFLTPWLEKFLDGGPVFAEQKLAITKEFKPCGYFDKGVWHRGVADALKIRGRVALSLDWKTGSMKEDSIQLALTAAVLFAHYPEVEAIRTAFIWLKDELQTTEDFRRSDLPLIWAKLLPRVQNLETATLQNVWPPKPSGLCRKHCKVSTCPHHGR